MTTLVTGATGFVGVNIVEALVTSGEEVVAFGQGGWPDSATAQMAGHTHLLHVMEGDVRSEADVGALFESRHIDRVVHGAAITAGLDRERNDPLVIADVNVRGTILVLQAAHRNGVKRIVHISSGAAYGDSFFDHERIFEDVTPSRPVSLYAITKLAGERVALRLRELLGLDLVCTRLGSVFGPWERPTGARDHVSIFLQLARIANAGDAALVPQATPRRDWVYSRDVATGIKALLDADALPHSLYHLSSGWEWEDPVADWCSSLKPVYEGFTYRPIEPGEEPNISFNETQDRAPMDIGLIQREIGFAPEFTPSQALDDYLEWFASTPGWLSMVTITP